MSNQELQMIAKIGGKHNQAIEMLAAKKARVFPIIDMFDKGRCDEAINQVMLENNSHVISDILSMLQLSGKVDNLSLDSQLVQIDKAGKLVEQTQYIQQVSICCNYIVRAMNLHKMDAINMVVINKNSRNLDLNTIEKLKKYNKFLSMVKDIYKSKMMNIYLEKARSNSSTVEKLKGVLIQLDTDMQYILSKTNLL